MLYTYDITRHILLYLLFIGSRLYILCIGLLWFILYLSQLHPLLLHYSIGLAFIQFIHIYTVKISMYSVLLPTDQITLITLFSGLAKRPWEDCSWWRMQPSVLQPTLEDWLNYCGLKIPCTVYKVLNDLAPGFISYMLVSHEPVTTQII